MSKCSNLLFIMNEDFLSDLVSVFRSITSAVSRMIKTRLFKQSLLDDVSQFVRSLPSILRTSLVPIKKLDYNDKALTDGRLKIMIDYGTKFIRISIEVLDDKVRYEIQTPMGGFHYSYDSDNALEFISNYISRELN